MRYSCGCKICGRRFMAKLSTKKKVITLRKHKCLPSMPHYTRGVADERTLKREPKKAKVT